MRKVFLLLCFLLLGLSIAFFSRKAFAQGTIQGGNGSGINIDPAYPEGYPSPEDVKALGAQWVRFGYFPNQYPDKTAYDQRFSEAVSKYSSAGINVVVILNQDSTPNLVVNNNTADLSQNNYINNFSNLAEHLAQTYQGKVSAYEIWNEGNAPSSSSLYVDPNQYSSLLAASYNSIKSEDPNTKVIIGGLIGGEPEYLQTVLKNYSGTSMPFDGIGVHPYDPTPSVSAAMLLSYFDIAKQTGRPLWITEIGWQGDQNPESQSAYIRDMYAFVQQHPDVIANMMWYAWSDGMNPGFGLVGADGKPKLSFQAFQQFAAKLKTLVSLTYQFKPVQVPPLVPVDENLKKAVAAKRNPRGAEEAEVPCDNLPYSESTKAAPTLYRSKTGAETPSMRTDANLNWQATVPATHCGQVKSQPIVLQEVAPFEPDEGDLCKTVKWWGEITYNYGNNDNFRIPFAEEIANHWAGTWDAEHIKESDMETKTKDAALPPTTTGGGIIQAIQSILGYRTEKIAQAPEIPETGNTTYGQASIDGQPYTGNPDTNIELNLSLRGEKAVNEGKGLVACDFPEGEPPDEQAPQLSDIVGTDPNQEGSITGVFQLGNTAKNWPVEAIGLKATPGQNVNAPGGGHDIGGGFRYMVLRADEHSITLANTRQDYSDAPVAELGGPGLAGYAVYISNIDVNPTLLATYEKLNSEGRKFLPVLRADQNIGTSEGDQVDVSVRDSMDFMDPRSKFDWWNQFPDAPAGQCKGGTGKRPSKRAPYDLFQKSGVIKKLSSQEEQDGLKCSFINYARKKGGNSMYANFAIDGTRVTDIPCPPTVLNPNASMADYTNWQSSWGAKWAKMSLIPNEKTIGQLVLSVCGDRQYPQTMAYPEVMRMGLAANELFKIYTDYESQKTYYRLNGDTNNLAQPLDKNQALGYIPPYSLAEGTSSDEVNPTPAPKVAETIPQAVSQPSNTPGIADKLTDLVTNLKDKAGEIAHKLELKVSLAQTPDQITATSNVWESDGKIYYQISVTNPSFVEDDMAAELVINGEKIGTSGYRNFRGTGRTVTFGSKGSGSDVEAWDPLPATAGKTYDISYHVVENYQFSGGTKAQRENFTGSVEGMGYCRASVGGDGAVTSSCGGQPPVAGTPGIPEGPQCAETPQCTASCTFCNRSQLMPTDTTVWNAGAAQNHTVIGRMWAGSDYDESRINLTWWIPAWDGTFAHLPPGCTVHPVTDTSVEGRVFADLSTGQIGKISCAKVSNRVIDVYNVVGFLGSAWNQAAGAGMGNIVGGFLNVFKPACDPKDPNSICAHPAIPSNLTSCTTNTSFVLDGNGFFSANPGASELTYGFNLLGNDGLSSVTQVLPKPGDKAKVLFYRIGGLCNADEWIGTKLLNTK